MCRWFLNKERLRPNVLVAIATYDTVERLFVAFSSESVAVVSFMMAFLCSNEMTAWGPMWPQGNGGGMCTYDNAANKKRGSLRNTHPCTGEQAYQHNKWKL
jgi:hypothetical protein